MTQNTPGVVAARLERKSALHLRSVFGPATALHYLHVIRRPACHCIYVYSDEAVLQFAKHFGVALLLHGHCPGKRPQDHNDMNMDPSKGLGRALLAALDQFAADAGHHELARIPLIFLGFSGAGPLSARLVGSFPKRVLAAVLSSPGHYEPLGIDTVELSSESLRVPQLIIAGIAYRVSGIVRPYQYFRKYRDRGTPWAFTVQNRSPHCCTANAKNLILGWLEAVVKERSSPEGTPLREVDQRVGWLAFFRSQQTEIADSFGLKTFEQTAAHNRKDQFGGDCTSAVGIGWLAAQSHCGQRMARFREASTPSHIAPQLMQL